MTALKIKSIAATLSAAVFMGTLGFFVREAGTQASVTTFFRFFVGLLLIGSIVIYNCYKHKTKLQFSLMSVVSGVSISLCILFYFLAIQSISIGLAAFTLYLGPVFAIIAEALISRKFPSLLQLLIIALAFGGFILISSLGSIEFAQMDSGLVYALLSGVFYGGYILTNRLINHNITLSERVFWQFLAAIVTIGVTCLATGASLDGIESGWGYLLIIGIVQGFMVLMLTGYAIKHLSSIEFGSLSYVEPLVALVLGFYLYDESLTTSQIIGIILIILASVTQCFALNSNKQ
ncbi:MAG: EamA family transporter [Rikenellaceae bacterium]